MLIISVSFSYAVTQKTRHKKIAPNNLTAAEIFAAEERLSELGYWVGEIDGVMDGGSRQALIAFQKVAKRKPTGILTAAELIALRAAERPVAQERGYQHIEVDLSRQVLFFVDEQGTITRILPISSGNNRMYEQDGEWQRAYTPCGRFTVYRKINGWRKSPLGLLYYPNYLTRGIAIHGNPAVPTTPASHGCIRIPMFAAKTVSELTPLGTVVLIYAEQKLLTEPID